MLQICFEAFPVERGFLAPPIKPLKYQLLYHIMVPLNSSAITADTIVLIVTSQLRLQRWPPLLKLRCTAYLPEPYIHLLARLAKLLGTGLATQHRITFAAPTPVMGKTQKVKGMGLMVLPVSPASLLSFQVDDTSLLRMQFKIELHKPLSHHLLYVAGVIGILDHAKKIVRVSHQMTRPSELWLDLLLKPQVQHILQEYIGKYWAEIAALRCTFGG